MNKKMDNKTDKMNKKMNNTTDPMNKKIQNGPDSTKRRAFPKRSDTMRRKTVAAASRKSIVTPLKPVSLQLNITPDVK